MSATVEFLYDFVSLPSFIAWKVLRPMVEAISATLVPTPVLVAGIFKATGNAGPMAIPAKFEWVIRDLSLWIKKRGLTVSPTLHLPFRSLPLLRGSFLAAERDETTRYIDAMYDAIFVHGRNLGDMPVVEASLREAELDAEAYLQGMEREDIKEKLRNSTDDAVARRVFGVPTFFVNGELFFGQDRIEFVMEALQGNTDNPLR